MPLPLPTTIPLSDLPSLLDDLLEEAEITIDPTGRALLLDDPPRRIVLPPALPDLPPGPFEDRHLDALHLPDAPQLLLLYQAGASALGVWDADDVLLAHKVFKRYVVRGKGRAQGAYLATRGKSRAGSRLRLANARRLLEETAARIEDWTAEYGPFSRVLWSCPVRLKGELREALTPALAPDLAPIRIPHDVNVPRYEELLRVRALLTRARLEELPPSPGET